MRKEYDFSKGERGKFHKSDTQLNQPLYLDEELYNYFSDKAAAKGTSLNQLINDLLRHDMALIENVK